MGAQPAGVSLGYWQDRDPLEAMETARLADQLGYGDLWLGEMATFDAFALATAVGACTRSVRLVVGPLPAPVRDPVQIAMGIASVAALTGRPVDVAIGSSSPYVVARWHGRPYERLPAVLRESVEALRPLLAGERARDYRLRLPAPGSSITVAAFGHRAVRVAAEVADRMVVNLCTAEQTGGLKSTLLFHGQRAGRAPIPLAAWIPVAVDPTDEGIEQLRRALVPYLGAPGYDEMFRQAGFGEVTQVAVSEVHPREVLAAIPADLVEAVAVVGDEATCRRRLDELAGVVDELVLVPVTAGDPGGRRTLEALAPA